MKTVKIVLNIDRLPPEVLSKLLEAGATYVRRAAGGHLYLDSETPRHDPLLVKVVSESTELLTKKGEDYVNALQERLNQVSLILEDPGTSHAQRKVAALEGLLLDEELSEAKGRRIEFIEEVSGPPGTLYRIGDAGGDREFVEMAVAGLYGWHQI